MKSANSGTRENTAGVETSPAHMTPKDTTPTKMSVWGLSPLIINGPPESPRQAVVSKPPAHIISCLI
eukprot:scaffold670792_cov36-Prasinocladus_malaysianus.AAC.1